MEESELRNIEKTGDDIDFSLSSQKEERVGVRRLF